MHTRYLLLIWIASSMYLTQAQEKKPLSAFPGSAFEFRGTFDCAGQFRNNKTHRSTFTGAAILDGKWLELTEQDIEPATGYVAKYLIGLDSQKNQLVEFDANNFGAATYTSAEGWQNDALTMTSSISDDAKAPYVANRFIYSVKDASSFTVDWQTAKSVALEWFPSDHLVCKRRH